MSEGSKLSRREIIVSAGMLGAGALFAKLGGFISNAEAKSGASEKWPYEKLDPAKAAEIAYNAWFDVFCAQATATGIFEQLREKVGEPWKSFPIGSLKFGMGGMLGWGVTCGSPVAASLVIGLAAPADMVNPMIHELLYWYSNTALPTYVPNNPKANKDKIVQTVSNSPLCHISVGKWMEKANHAFTDIERRDRCARVSASVAYHTVELLNSWKDGTCNLKDAAWNAPATVGIPAQQNCNECHGSNIPTPPKAKK